MHRIAAVTVVVLGIALTGYSETVTNVRGSQRPNSNLVDIYYDLNAVDGWSYTVEIAIEGRTNEVTAATFSGDVGKGVAPGKNRHIVWEAGADWLGKKGDVKAAVTATIEAKNGKPKKVQLWEGGPYWADRNIGADNPWEYGLYFWWGDTVGHRPSGTTFSFSFASSNTPTYGKSVATLQSEGWITSNGVLAPAHDAAHVKWGGSWRMPTLQELNDLRSKCDWTWMTMNDVNGYVVRGRGAYSSCSIFFPAAGRGSEGGKFYLSNGRGSRTGHYWSSVPATTYLDHDKVGSFMLYFTSDSILTREWAGVVSDGKRYYGYSIRPVQ